MKRRAARETAFKLTYEMVMTGQFNPETKDELWIDADKDARSYIDSVIDGITAHKDRLKAVIVKYAKGYEFDRIYEIMYTDTPPAVVANEAVELAKTYSDTKSHAFINGILASVIKGDGADE